METPRLTGVGRASPEQWDSIWRTCPYATFFHSREWAEVWERYTEGRLSPAPLLLGFSDGARALLPLSVRKLHRGLVRAYVSGPAGTYGGWISDSTLDERHTAAVVHFVTTRLASVQLRFNPYGPQLTGPVEGAKEDSTSTLELTAGFSAVTGSWSKGHFSAARKGQREGVVSRIATTEKDWRDYYSIYEDSLRRWGDTASSRYEWPFFEALWSMKSPNVKLWVAEVQGTMAAGALCFYSPTCVVYWHGAALEKLFPFRPVHTLLWTTIEDACANGYRYFDFNPSGGHQGVKAFKRGFGTHELPSPVISTESSWQRFVGRAARAVRVLR